MQPFMVGWIASKYPCCKKIDDLGFEIGSHTHMHQLMYNQSKHEVENDLKKSIHTIEDLTSKKLSILGHRVFQSQKKTNGYLKYYTRMA